ncbi:MAG: LPS translocon maturation chaperone LptM [Stenotrophobium sp.]
MGQRILICSGLLAALCLSACGQSGALYLPDQAPVRKPLPYEQTQPEAAVPPAKPDVAPQTTPSTTAPAAGTNKETP